MFDVARTKCMYSMRSILPYSSYICRSINNVLFSLLSQSQTSACLTPVQLHQAVYVTTCLNTTPVRIQMILSTTATSGLQAAKTVSVIC